MTVQRRWVQTGAGRVSFLLWQDPLGQWWSAPRGSAEPTTVAEAPPVWLPLVPAPDAEVPAVSRGGSRGGGRRGRRPSGMGSLG